jgi:hypothetical protein
MYSVKIRLGSAGQLTAPNSTIAASRLLVLMHTVGTEASEVQ